MIFISLKTSLWPLGYIFSKFNQISPSAEAIKDFSDIVRGNFVFLLSFTLNFLKTDVSPTLTCILPNLSPKTWKKISINVDIVFHFNLYEYQSLKV